MQACGSRLILFVALVGCSSDPEPEVPFEPGPTIASVAADPLQGTDKTSCPVYQEERCHQQKQQRCEVYDTNGSTYVDQVDPLLRKVLLYDRWFDRFSSPLGLTAERVFDGPMPGDTPESEWSDPDRFLRWAGAGDSAIWTGAALVSDIFRYTQTRTEADYQRMEDRVRVLVRNFEVTGIPGYLARYHYLLVPPGTPQNDQLILEHASENNPGNVDIEIPNLDLEGLPPEYKTGVDDGQGGIVQGTPLWTGDPSIDQYTGPMMAFPLAYNLLRDEPLKQKMVHHLTCYLKRLERIEITHLQARPDLIEELKGYFGGSGLKLDPGDPDLTALDELIWYVHPGINRENADTFVGTCPDTVQTKPVRVIDVREESFEYEMLQLAADINRDIRRREYQIDHFYIVNLRGGDASHLMHLAAIAYYFTGDEQYKSFLFDELIGKIGTLDTADTMMAFRQPDFCFKFYGDHITYGTHWHFITMLNDSPLKERMIGVMQEEAWEKALYNHHSSKFNVMYGGVMPETVAPNRQAAIDTAIEQLRVFGGNGGTALAPRRTHDVSRQSIVDQLPSHITIRCPTEDQRRSCEEAGTLLGIDLEGAIITRECDGRPAECVMADGQCADGLASEGLPANLRIYADFMWQRDPFEIGNPHAVDGQKQSPGRDLSEPYWLARYYGFVTEGAGQVLAWRDVGSCQ